MTRVQLGSVALMVMLSGAAGARADAVGIPESCPAGTRGDGCHGAEYCTPQTCTLSSECAAGETCAEVRFCVRGKACFGRDGSSTPVSDYYQPCGAGMCPEGDCGTARICTSSPVPPLLDSGPRRDAGESDRSHAKYGCGCEVPGRDDAGPILPLALAGTVLGIVAIVAARRRR